MTYHQKRAWLWSRDYFEILRLVVMQCDALVCQRQLSNLYMLNLSYKLPLMAMSLPLYLFRPNWVRLLWDVHDFNSTALQFLVCTYIAFYVFLVVMLCVIFMV